MSEVPPAEDLIAMLDQAAKGLRDMARVVRSYYEGLVEVGFSEKQALYLSACWVRPPDPPSDDVAQ